MPKITLHLSDAEIRSEVSGILTSGMVGVEVNLVCDEAWEGLHKTLVCRAGDITKTVLVQDDRAVTAHETLVAGKWLELGVEGRNDDGSVVIPTLWERCCIVLPGADGGADPTADPTLPIWAQLQSRVAALEVPPVPSEIGALPGPLWAKVGQHFQVAAVNKIGRVVAVEAVDMPTGGNYELPAATADALGGIKAEPATEADTQPVRIGADGMLYTAPGGGVPGNGETVAAPLPLLADVTSEEALSHFEVTLSKRAVRCVLVQISVPASEAVGAVCYGALNGGLWDAIIFGNTALAANAKKWMELELMEGGLAKYTVSESSGNLWNLNTIRTAGALEKISYVDSIGIRLLGQNTAPAGTRLQVWGE